MVVGYRLEGEQWQDVERGATPFEDVVDEQDLSNVDAVAVHYINEHGDDIYIHIPGPWYSWDQFWYYIDYILDPYGVQ